MDDRGGFGLLLGASLSGVYTDADTRHTGGELRSRDWPRGLAVPYQERTPGLVRNWAVQVP